MKELHKAQLIHRFMARGGSAKMRVFFWAWSRFMEDGRQEQKSNDEKMRLVALSKSSFALSLISFLSVSGNAQMVTQWYFAPWREETRRVVKAKIVEELATERRASK